VSTVLLKTFYANFVDHIVKNITQKGSKICIMRGHEKQFNIASVHCNLNKIDTKKPPYDLLKTTEVQTIEIEVTSS